MDELSSTRAFRGGGPEWIRVLQPALFLRMEIDRDLTVHREPSFAYPVLTDFFPVGQSLPFSGEFADADGIVLSCFTLREDCWHCAPDCWPKRIRQTVSLPPRARVFRVFAGRDVIYEEHIVDPPELQVKCSYGAEAERIQVTWFASVAGPKSPRRQSAPDLWYLVQYHSRGAWRGLGPRTQDTEAQIAIKLMGLPVSVPIRVLATTGIATGINECAVVDDTPFKRPEMGLTAVTPDPTDAPVRLGGRLRVHAIDSGGRSLPDASVRWYDEAGRELERGRDLDVSKLGAGEHVVHAVATGTGERPLFRTFVLHRREPQADCYLAASTDRPLRDDSPVHLHEKGEMHDY
jgi:hypothetical protein